MDRGVEGSGVVSDRVCRPPIVDPDLGLLRYEASENIFSSIGEGRITWVALERLAQYPRRRSIAAIVARVGEAWKQAR